MNRPRRALALCALLVGMAALGPAGSVAWEGPAPSVPRATGAGVQRADLNLVDRWARARWPGIYAGDYPATSLPGRRTVREGGYVVVGFTSGAGAHLREARRLPGIQKPARIISFPYRPRYSLRYLLKIRRRIVREIIDSPAHHGLVTSIGTDFESNRIDVSTTDVRKLARVIRQRFGPQAPIHVFRREAPAET